MGGGICGRRHNNNGGDSGGSGDSSIKARVCKKEITGRQGFEPRYADPESAVLPLDDLPIIIND
jgi:hypothetical protein